MLRYVSLSFNPPVKSKWLKVVLFRFRRVPFKGPQTSLSFFVTLLHSVLLFLSDRLNHLCYSEMLQAIRQDGARTKEPNMVLKEQDRERDGGECVDVTYHCGDSPELTPLANQCESPAVSLSRRGELPGLTYLSSQCPPGYSVSARPRVLPSPQHLAVINPGFGRPTCHLTTITAPLICLSISLQ